MKNLFKEAHKLTKKMVKEYKVDYQAQFGLNLSYLHEIKGEEKEMLKGSEKQVKWAEEILKDINTVLDNIVDGAKEVYPDGSKNQRVAKLRVERTKELLEEIDHAGIVIEKFKEVSYLNGAKKAEEILSLMQVETYNAGYGKIGYTYPGKLTAYAYDKAR